VVLDIGHRERYTRQENLLRTMEEPGTRTWLAREDHHLVGHAGRYLLLARGPASHERRIASYHSRFQAPAEGQRLTACLTLLSAHRRASGIRLELEARGPCPNDLAIRIGHTPRPRRVDLLFGGRLSPAHLRAGDRVFSDHALGEASRSRNATNAKGARGVVYVGALRSSGARPEPSDPSFVQVPLEAP
jgi:hypothetical protein